MTELPKDELHTLQPLLAQFTLIEFGNKKNPSGTYREFYKANGCTEYACIDWNGKDGAFPLDCNYSLCHTDVGFESPADIVTNFGFSEHVTDQPAYWQNHHAFCGVGGFMCGVTPNPGDWPSHGILQPHIDFYWALAEENGYGVEGIWINEDRNRPTVCYRLRKLRDAPFVMPPEWETLIIPTPAPTAQARKQSRIE